MSAPVHCLSQVSHTHLFSHQNWPKYDPTQNTKNIISETPSNTLLISFCLSKSGSQGVEPIPAAIGQHAGTAGQIVQGKHRETTNWY